VGKTQKLFEGKVFEVFRKKKVRALLEGKGRKEY
jgi:hypothetical protein